MFSLLFSIANVAPGEVDTYIFWYTLCVYKSMNPSIFSDLREPGLVPGKILSLNTKFDSVLEKNQTYKIINNFWIRWVISTISYTYLLATSSKRSWCPNLQQALLRANELYVHQDYFGNYLPDCCPLLNHYACWIQVNGGNRIIFHDWGCAEVWGIWW